MNHPVAQIRAVSDARYEVLGLDLPAFSSLRFWVFDLEATGLDTSRERVTQIAGVPVEGGRILEEEAFSQLVDPGEGITIPEEVQDLTGITPERVRGAPPFSEAWQACVRAARGSDLWLGQSVFEFDVPLLEMELARHGLEPTLPPMLDTVVLATALLGEPERRWSTSALIDRFSVDTGGLRRHDALDDVKIVARILLPMIELVCKDHADRLAIPADRPLSIKRHPPIRTRDEPQA
jgi:DNA polymerase III epsilon subunit-like protein